MKTDSRRFHVWIRRQFWISIKISGLSPSRSAEREFSVPRILETVHRRASVFLAAVISASMSLRLNPGGRNQPGAASDGPCASQDLQRILGEIDGRPLPERSSNSPLPRLRESSLD